MYNLNGSMSGQQMLGVDGCSQSSIVTSSSIVTTSNGHLTVNNPACTPLTPEILNSVMAMTNPLEYSFPATSATTTTTKVSQQPSTDSHSSSSSSPFESPMTSTPANGMSKEATTPTVQQTCSQLIKTSLKLSLEMKRKTSTTDSSSIDMPICKKIKPDYDSSDDEMMYKPARSSNPCLTIEDEDRRRRRRERNKIAATKCRMKKRERTINLVSEAEILDSQNIDLKTQLRNLEIERRSLNEMLKAHATNCVRGDGVQLPALNVSIGKYLDDNGFGQSNQTKCNESTKTNRNGSLKVTSNRLQKIPSVNTLKFNGRRQTNPQSTVTLINNNMNPVTVAVTSTTSCIPVQMTNVSPITDCKPLPSIDMSFCEGRNESLTPTSSYCKSLMSNSSDCYAMSSPDSGFIKSPVDMGGNYSLPVMIKTDYIPNCEPDLMNHQHHQHRLDPTNDPNNADTSIDFILKSELVDGNDSPYTTVQSADRFLFDGCAETFDSDIDAANQNHSSLIDHSGHIQGLTKDHLLINNGIHNNNNNSQLINNNNNHHHHHHHGNGLNSNLLNGTDHLNNFGVVNNSTVISTGLHPNSAAASVIEFNTTCQQFMDSSLLKGDFLSQNCEFLSLAHDSCDSQFTTDLDSGVTTYTNMTNGSGCLA